MEEKPRACTRLTVVTDGLVDLVSLGRSLLEPRKIILAAFAVESRPDFPKLALERLRSVMDSVEFRPEIECVFVLEYHDHKYSRSVSVCFRAHRYVSVMLDASRLLTPQEVARNLGVGASTVKDWIRTRGLPAKRLTRKALRIDPIELERWLERDGRISNI